MADLTLRDGRVIVFDLYQVTRAEFVAVAGGKLTPEQDDALLARVSGLTVEEVQALPQPEWRRLALAFFRKAREPLADPN